MHGYTGESVYREKAAQTMGLLAGVVSQYGIFAATYGIAGVYFSTPHRQVVIVGDDELASQLYSEATAWPHSGRSVLKLTFSQTAKENLPPALAATIPNLPEVKESQTVAFVCSGFSCGPPAHNVAELKTLMTEGRSAA
jgi:uncharacterized protein YyaL (SSP411 family)